MGIITISKEHLYLIGNAKFTRRENLLAALIVVVKAGSLLSHHQGARVFWVELVVALHQRHLATGPIQEM